MPIALLSLKYTGLIGNRYGPFETNLTPMQYSHKDAEPRPITLIIFTLAEAPTSPVPILGRRRNRITSAPPHRLAPRSRIRLALRVVSWSSQSAVCVTSLPHSRFVLDHLPITAVMPMRSWTQHPRPQARFGRFSEQVMHPHPSEHSAYCLGARPSERALTDVEQSPTGLATCITIHPARRPPRLPLAAPVSMPSVDV